MRARGIIPFLVAVFTSAALTASVAAAASLRAGAIPSAFHAVTAQPSPSATHRFFAPSSVWNKPVPANASLDPSSTVRVTSLLRYLRHPGHGPWINTYQYSVPVYRVPANQRTVKVVLDASGPLLQRALVAVPLPPNPVPAAGTDASLVVYQPATDKMWEFWQFQRKDNQWHARWGGAMSHVSTSQGYYSSQAWLALPSHEGWDWGSSASSLPAVAGLMTIAELRAGRIDHALAVAAPEACAGWFVWPAQRTDGVSSDRHCLPEGAHLRLDPRLDLTKLHLPPVALMMAQAMQKYGIIVHDTTHSSFSFYAEQPTGGPDPYVGSNGVFDGLQEWEFLPTIPWDHLQLLAMRPCVSSPCLPSALLRKR